MKKESVFLMEPMMPTGSTQALDDLVFTLAQKSSALAGQVHPIVQREMGNLVRSMNCYYSNLIEGHNTHPWDIERALHNDYSNNEQRRNLQLEAVAHIHVQKMIDDGKHIETYPLTMEYAKWLHQEFCTQLPQELLIVENPDTGEKAIVAPGEIRDKTVKVGHHVPPYPKSIMDFMKRFDEAYNPKKLSQPQRIIASAAAHHRFLWVHPFFDGNGRVARLMSYAALLREGIGNPLWSIARGLARNAVPYKKLLMSADSERLNDLDGRGHLSQEALINFCHFFLTTAIDQVNYMHSLLQTKTFIRRLKQFTDEEVYAGVLPKNTFGVLREAWFSGEVLRKDVQALTGYKERMARKIISSLLDKGLLVSDGPKASLRLGFPMYAVERLFPSLYPSDLR